jgi:hypothetical protein
MIVPHDLSDLKAYNFRYDHWIELKLYKEVLQVLLCRGLTSFANSLWEDHKKKAHKILFQSILLLSLLFF